MAVITAKQRKFLARAGVAMPDGSYYIRDAKELQDAIDAVGRGNADHDVIRKHIIKRANDLKLSSKIPGNWNPDGSLKDASSAATHSDMHWGVDHQRELEIYTRVAEGRGIKHEHTAVRQCMSAASSARHKGSVESYSRECALRLQGQKERVKSGHGTELDRVDLHGLAASEDPVKKLAVKPVEDKTPAIHSSTTEEEFFEHFGIKGMHWGVQRSRAQLLEKADNHEKTSAIHAHLANEYGRQHQEIQHEDINSRAFKTVYGDHASLQNEGLFRLKTGRSKAQALEEVNQTIQSLHNSHARSANRHSKKAGKLREMAKTAQHDGFVTGFADDDDFLEHFGIKGMRWGVRGSRDSSGGGSGHPVSADAARAKASAATVKRHGTSALSNQDLQHLVNRINLEKQHSALTTQQDHHGRDVVLKFLANQGKQQLNAVANEAATAGRKKLFKVGAGLAVKTVVGAGKHALR